MPSYRGMGSLYRAWLYRQEHQSREVGRDRPRGPVRQIAALDRCLAPSKAPAWFSQRLRLYRPDANPDRYWWWQREVMIHGGWTCSRCGAGRRTSPLQAHHVRHWAEDERGRYDPTNGVILCRPCHEWTHGHAFTQDGDRRLDLHAQVQALTRPIKARYGFS